MTRRPSRPAPLGERIVVELTDCEQVREGPLAQPVNALSSLAYLAGGAYVVGRLWGSGRAGRVTTVAVGTALALNAAGSLAYHGRPGPWTHWLHDVAIVALLGSPLAVDAGRALGWDDVAAGVALTGITAAGGAVLYVAPRSTNALTGALGALAALGDLATAADRKRRGEPPSHRRSARVAVLAAAGALAGNVLGRTGAPTCKPESVWQGHAAWHALGALAAAAYATVVVDRAGPPR